MPNTSQKSYFQPELFDFLKRLKKNNRREWFQKRKSEYDTHGRDAALCFISDLAFELHEISAHLVCDPRPTRGSLFRIYRDTRFSHNKTPYKTHLAMRFNHSKKDVHSPGFYLHLEPGASFAAAGLWHPDPPALLKVRTAIVSREADWRKVRKLINWDDAGKLSRSPRGFPAGHEFEAELKLKDLGTSIEFSDDQVCSPRFMQTFFTACRKMSPLAQFLSQALDLKY